MTKLTYVLRYPVKVKADDGTTIWDITKLEFPEFPKAKLVMGINAEDFNSPKSTAQVLELQFGIPMAVIEERFHAADLLVLGKVVRDFLWGASEFPEDTTKPKSPPENEPQPES